MPVAYVTGGSRGIGRAIALGLAGDGYDVAVGYAVQAEAADGVAEEVRGAGRRAITVAGDLARAEVARQLVAQVERELGPVDVLIANAGIVSPPTGVLDIRIEDWEEMLAVNLTAPFLLTQSAFAGMCERGFGRIVFISSVAAYTGGLVGAHYAASKAGLHGLAHSLARQGAPAGVTVNVVAPALVDTDMIPEDPEVRRQLGASRAVGRLGSAEEVADLVAAVVRNGYLSNQSILIDGGSHPT
ncbi:MAG TPA: SDR family NAD(P)-dependent oxidoreductase [Solirubrobacteraceae bacterium]|nr:SDR family NAD(P)-dependent oxidoreductase [Solirubrobacteraceae bacterium]